MRNRLRQRAIIALLKANDSPPKILASQLFFLFDVKPQIDSITDNMTVENVLVAVGNILRSRQRLNEDVEVWAKGLFEAAGLPFSPGITDSKETAEPSPALSVVSSSKPAAPKTSKAAQPKSRRVYLEMSIQLLERGITYRGLIDAIMERFPSLNRETVSTFVSDVQNPRYSPIKDRKVIKLPPDGRLVFEDKIKPALTVIENPNYAGAETEPVTEVDRKASSSTGDV